MKGVQLPNSWSIHVTDGMVAYRTSSVPISVLRYLLDKVHYSGLKFSLYPLLFPNKETKTLQRDKVFLFNSLNCQAIWRTRLLEANSRLRHLILIL